MNLRVKCVIYFSTLNMSCSKICKREQFVSQIDMQWEPKPRTNIITNKQLVDLYRENAESLGVEFETDPERMSLFTGMCEIIIKMVL